MERNSQNSQGYKLESQIREAFGRVTYSQTCHDKKINRLLKTNEKIKVWQIILSSFTTGSLLATIISEQRILGIIGAVISIILLILNAYSKNFQLIETAEKHKEASNLLWKIREEYVSLLVDFEILELDQIICKRDDLQERTYKVYSTCPRTDSKNYKEAQKALKIEEEQTFSESEIDVMYQIQLDVVIEIVIWPLYKNYLRIKKNKEIKCYLKYPLTTTPNNMFTLRVLEGTVKEESQTTPLHRV